MKTLFEIRSKMPAGDHIMNKKIDGMQLMIHKEKGKFVVYINGEKLDSYSSVKQAEKMGQQFIKQLKAMK